MESNDLYTCTICGAGVDENELLVVRDDTAEMAHDWHSAQQVEDARTASAPVADDADYDFNAPQDYIREAHAGDTAELDGDEDEFRRLNAA